MRRALRALLPLSAALLACDAAAQPLAPLPRAAAAADVDLLARWLDEVHPDPYSAVPRDSIARRFRDAVATLPDTISREALWLRLAPVLALVADGHTGLSAPMGGLRAEFSHGAPLLPLVLAVDEAGRVRVRASGAPEVQPGDALAAVAGRPIDAWLEEIMAAFGGESRALRLRLAVADLSRQLWLRGASAPFDVAVEDQAGTTRRVRLAGVGLDGLRVLAGAAAPRGSDLEYRTLPGRVGYLEFRSMAMRPDSFGVAIAHVFRRVRADSVATLVVDLRRNGGGNSVLGDTLLAHLTGRPYRMAARKEWKLSGAYRAWVRARLARAGTIDTTRPASYPPDVRALFDGPDGKVLAGESPAHTAPSAEPRFDGPVCFLIGSGTFSSAMKLADAVKAFRLATLVGEETGGVPNSFGEVFQFTLPNSGLAGQISTARWVRASGDARERGGVLPDVEVRPTAADLRAGRDPALERAKSCPARAAR